MSVKWTEDQKKVIETKGKNLLVSAAAGSGKTAVLVERILSLITDPENPVDVDRLLITTFTNAAASEMRERIGKALGMRILEEPENEWLQRQESLLNRAQITTIHGFCMYVIRNYFHTIHLNPNFRIADVGELRMLEQDVAEEILEEACQISDPSFIRFADSYGRGNRGSGLEEMILQLYEYAIASPQPVKWLKECAEHYKLPKDACWSDFAGGAAVFSELKMIVSDCQNQIRTAKNLASLPGGPAPYQNALQADEDILQSLLDCKTVEEFEEILLNVSYTRLPSRRSKVMIDVDDELCDQIMQIRNQMKGTLKSLIGQYFEFPSEELFDQMRDTAENAKCYVDLTLRFMERLTEKKRKKNILDFSDQEHLALQILTREVDGELVPSEVAKVFSDYFVEIMVDEYQDSNLVQEAILESISGKQNGKENRFMVGDVKQSIYRFRQADPSLFLEKYYQYKDGIEGVRIDLHQNFRSREEVLGTVNEIFGKIMCQELGGIEYDDSAALKKGASYPENPSSKAELLLLSQEEWKDLHQECHWSKQEAEAHLVAERIRQMLKDEKVTENGKLRPVRPGDIVILLRVMAGWSDVFVRVLKEEGIPAVAQSKEGYFQTMEIETILSYLRVLDNPTQEIPLAAAMHGQLGGFSSEELAKIKAAYKDSSFVKACDQYLAEGPEEAIRAKLSDFFEQIDLYRKKAVYLSIHELLWQILNETGYLDKVRALPGGEQRSANVEMLLTKAHDYEKISYHGLFHFIRYIEKMQKYRMDFGEASLFGAGGEAVQIMSIHHSKGLEFPVVLVAGLGKNFNRQESRDNAVFHNHYGIGLDYVDLENRMRCPTLLKKLIRRQNLLDGLAEELRILYVAMTRAKEKLILIGMAKKKLLEEKPIQMDKLPFLKLTGASCDLEWILSAAGKNESAYNKIQIPFEEVVKLAVKEQIERALSRDEMEKVILFRARDQKLYQEIEKRLAWKYPWDLERAGKQKYSVTELKKMRMEEEAEEIQELYPESDFVPLVPQFIEKTKEKTGAAKGTIYHMIMEYLDFSQINTISQIEKAIQKLADSGKIKQEDLKSVWVKDFLPYSKSELARRMASAKERGELFQEQPFVIALPASEVEEGRTDEFVLVQGIIDAFFYEKDEIVIVDYKTDRVNQEEELISRYHSQLDYYEKALTMMTGKKVKERFLYSFALKKIVSV